MTSVQKVLRQNDPVVVSMARKKIGVFGANARPIILARAENFRRDGMIKPAKFWQAVADEIGSISA